jgi:hypothetical protein
VRESKTKELSIARLGMVPSRMIGSIALLAAVLSGCIPIAYSQWPQRGVTAGSAQPESAVPVGPYYALVIGNNDYRYLPKLQTAVLDATEVAKLLQESYGFVSPTVLINATRSQILSALNAYRRNLPENANLLIYYAGHGTKDRDTKKAYWLPVNARADNDVEWISASTITEEISALRSTPHILVISDSCYSGELTRSTPAAINPSERSAYLRRMLESPSRTLMASGRDEPVADSGADGHSQFASVLIKSLQQMDEDKFTASDLFQRYIQQGVAGGSNQVPQYSFIQNSGHAYGDFVFSRANNVVPGGPGLVGSSLDTDVIDSTGRSATTTPTVLIEDLTALLRMKPPSDIAGVLHYFKAAYNLKDERMLSEIWPNASSVNKGLIVGHFKQAESIRMTLQLGEPKFGPDHRSATVTGKYSEVYTPKGGSPLSLSPQDITFTLRKTFNAWRIVDLER